MRDSFLDLCALGKPNMARVSCKGHSTNRKALPSATPSRHTTKPLSPSLARSPDFFFFAESQVSTRQSFAECLKNSTWQRGLCRHIVCHVRLGGTRQKPLLSVFLILFFLNCKCSLGESRVISPGEQAVLRHGCQDRLAWCF